MTYTRFGEFVRILRIRRHEVMGDMAKKLGVKSSFLSAVENGKKNVPEDWVEKLVAGYALSVEMKRTLERAISESRTQYKLSVMDKGVVQRKAAAVFAREFENMDDDTAIKVLELLSQKEGAKTNGC